MIIQQKVSAKELSTFKTLKAYKPIIPQIKDDKVLRLRAGHTRKFLTINKPFIASLRDFEQRIFIKEKNLETARRQDLEQELKTAIALQEASINLVGCDLPLYFQYHNHQSAYAIGQLDILCQSSLTGKYICIEVSNSMKQEKLIANKSKQIPKLQRVFGENAVLIYAPLAGLNQDSRTRKASWSGSIIQTMDGLTQKLIELGCLRNC